MSDDARDVVRRRRSRNRRRGGSAPRGVTLPPPPVRPADYSFETFEGWAKDRLRGMLGGDGPSGGFRQIPEGIGRVTSNVIRGLPRLAGGVGLAAVSPFRIGFDVLRGDKKARSGAVAAIGTPPWSWDNKPEAGEFVDRYNPLYRELLESFGRTGLNLMQPSRYAKAWDEGLIVDTLIEDAGNIAVLTAPVTKAAVAAAPGSRTAVTLAAASRIGNRLADAPIAVPLQAARRTALGLRELAEAQPGLRLRYPGLFTEEGRLARQAVRRASASGARRAHRVLRDLRVAADEINDPAIEALALATRNKIADVYALGYDMARRAGVDMTDPVALEALRREVTSRDLPEQSFTPELADLSLAYKQGLLSEEQLAKLERAQQAVAHTLEPLTADALAGEGWLGRLDPQQLGDEPLDSAVMARLDELPEPVANEIRSRWFHDGESWSEIAIDIPELAGILLDPMVYPAPWRPALMLANRLQAAGLPMPITPQGLKQLGITRPEYVPGSESRILRPRIYTDEQALVSEGIPGLRKQSAERTRRRAEVQAYSFRTLAEATANAVRLSEANKALAKFIEEAAVNRVNSVIPDRQLANIYENAAREAKLMRGTEGQQRAEAGRIADEVITRKLEEAGWEVFIGDDTVPRHGDFDPATPVRLGRGLIGPDTIILPTGVKSVLEPRWKPAVFDPIVKALEASNTFIKRNTLPFSVRWHLGDLVGGFIMGWLEGGVTPREFLRAQKRVSELSPEAIKAIEEGVLDHPELVADGFAMQELMWLRRDSPNALREPRTGLGRAYNKFRSKSYELNSAINRFNRHHYVLARMWRKLEDAGIDIDNLDANPALWDQPEVQRAISEAVADANKTMGDFDNLSAFERRIMRGFWTYYTWMRHITMLTYRVARDNPQRLVWTLRLGQYGTDYSEELPPWLVGSIGIGRWLFPTSFVNPLYDVAGDSIIGDPFRQMNPAIKVAVAGATGADMSNQFAQVTRPYGTGRYDELGRPINTPLALRPAELAYYAANFLPLPRAALNVAPTGELFGIGLGPHPRYRQGTMMVDSRGRPIATNPRLAEIARISLPVPADREKVRDVMRAAEKRRERLRQQKGKVRIGQ